MVEQMKQFRWTAARKLSKVCVDFLIEAVGTVLFSGLRISSQVGQSRVGCPISNHVYDREVDCEILRQNNSLLK